MARNALMESPRDGQMFVPPEKVQAFLEAGWLLIQPADAPLSIAPAPVAVETETGDEEKPVRRKPPKKS